MNTETDGEPLVLKGGLGMIVSCYDDDDNGMSDEEVDKGGNSFNLCHVTMMMTME